MAIIGSRLVSTPPMLNNSNYNSWKNDIEIFTCSRSIEQWKCMIRGYDSPRDMNGLEIVNVINMSLEQTIAYSHNCQAMNIILSALD